MLSSTTFLIPLRIDSEERHRNMLVVLHYLVAHTQAKIIVIENAAMQDKMVKDVAASHRNRITYVFQHNTDSLFHRTKILNDALDLARTPVVVVHDSDVLLPLDSMHIAEQLILNRQADCVHPWTEPPGCYYTDYKEMIMNPEILNEPERSNPLMNQAQAFHTSGSGLSIFFSRHHYIRMGAENQGFAAYAPEDFERILRVSRFGLRYQRVTGPVYHLNHPRTPNSDRNNPFMEHNEQLYEHLAMNLSTGQYKQYYNERNSVTVHVGGGLGNRIFQVAFGLAYAHRTGKTFTLHHQHYEHENVHNGTNSSGQNYLHTIFSRFSRLADFKIDTIQREPEGDYCKWIDYPSLSRNVLFYGYFQNERYFKECEHLIRDLFSCPADVAQQLREKYPDLDQAFFLHNRIQRKGVDGVSLHAVPLDDYFVNAVKHVVENYQLRVTGDELKQHVIYVFSNMPEKNNQLIERVEPIIRNSSFVIRTLNEPDEVRALWLMSLCRIGGICANSSYSWWGSWLNDNPAKIVTMPEKFLTNDWDNTGIFYPGVKVIENG